MTTSTTRAPHRRKWRLAIVAALCAGVAGLVSMTPSNVSATTENVVIYFAVCDANTASDTVKIKKINEDGTGLSVVGDTTIAHCVQPATRYLTGLAVSGEYAYFSWINADGSGAGVGRIKTNGTGTAEINFASAPAGVGSFQMSPTPLNGYLYAYVNDAGGQGPVNSRIMRVALSTGVVTNCYTPSGTVVAMNIGVGKDAVYYSTITQEDALKSQLIMKVSADCSTASQFLNLADLAPDGLTHQFTTEGLATLVAESDANMFLYTQTLNQPAQYGLSQVSTSGTISTIQSNLFKASDGRADSQVWGFNYLYFKDGGATKMYRVAPGGAPEQVFADHIKGVLHHFSVVKEPVTTPNTKTPLLISKKGVTGQEIAADLGLTIPKGSKIKLVVAKKSRKACAVKKKRVVSTTAGKDCRVTITITPKKGKAIKRTTSFTTS